MVLAAVFQDEIDAPRDLPVERAAEGQRDRVPLGGFARLDRMEPSLLVGWAAGDVPFQTGPVNEVIADTASEGELVRDVLECILEVLGRGQDEIQAPRHPVIKLRIHAVIVGALDVIHAADVADVIEFEAGARRAPLQAGLGVEIHRFRVARVQRQPGGDLAGPVVALLEPARRDALQFAARNGARLRSAHDDQLRRDGNGTGEFPRSFEEHLIEFCLGVVFIGSGQ